MTKPTPTAEDIKVARRIYSDVQIKFPYDELQDVIAQALADTRQQERERCKAVILAGSDNLYMSHIPKTANDIKIVLQMFLQMSVKGLDPKVFCAAHPKIQKIKGNCWMCAGGEKDIPPTGKEYA